MEVAVLDEVGVRALSKVKAGVVCFYIGGLQPLGQAIMKCSILPHHKHLLVPT